jgi:hypothetical protein
MVVVLLSVSHAETFSLLVTANPSSIGVLQNKPHMPDA